MLDFLLDLYYRNMFMVDMLLVVFLSGALLPKRKLFAVRLIAAVVIGMLGGYLVSVARNALNITGSYSWIVDAVGYFLQFSLATVLAWLSYKAPVWHMIFVGACGWFVQHAAYDLESIIWSGSDTYRIVHFSVLLVFFSAIWLIFLRRMKEESLQKINFKQVLPMILIMFVICNILNLLAAQYEEISFSFYLADMCCNIIALCYAGSLLNISVIESENEKVQKLLAQSQEQYHVFKENVDLINIKCHDLRHQINAFRQDGKLNAETFSEIEHIVDEYDCTIQTGNSALDVVLTEKRMLCNSKKIRFTCIADGRGMQYMNPYDIYSLFGNALENAVEAVENIEDPEKRVIGLSVRGVGDLYAIHIQNYTGTVVLFNKDGMPITHKKDKNNHGYGVRSMMLIAEKYGGEVSFNIKNDIFNLNMILPYRREGEEEKDPMENAA